MQKARVTWVFPLAAAAVAVVAAPTLHAAAQTKPSGKVDIVIVSGCLTPAAGETWLLTSATDPVVATQKGGEIAKDAPVTGKNRYRLIGLLEFNTAAHKGHTVRVKGLFIPAGDEKRINITSLQHVAPTCPPAPKP